MRHLMLLAVLWIVLFFAWAARQGIHQGVLEGSEAGLADPLWKIW